MPRNNPQISVIMPVYNVDRYIARALESVQRQTLEDIEILVVDDGSTDRSGDIADRIAEHDIRVDVFHITNSGAPAARNFALDKARGTYIFFMDADDWIEPTMLADLLATAHNDEAELVVCGFYIDTYYSESEHLSEKKSLPSKSYASQRDFRLDAWRLFDQNLLYTPWNKLFVRARIEELGLRFPPTFMDDFPFVLDYIRDVERVSLIEKAYYHFIRQRAESETSRWRADMYEKREEEHGWMLDLYEHWDLSHDEPSMEMVQRRYIERLVGCVESVCSPECPLSAKEKRDFIRRMITSERARAALRLAQPHSRMMKLMLGPIRAGSVGLTMAEGNVISWVKHHNTKLFATLKARR